MMKKVKILLCVFVFCIFFVADFVGCENSSDGPLSISNETVQFEGQGFFLSASLDSGRFIHLASDTLYLTMSQIWSFSNCALRSIDLNIDRENSVLWIEPVIQVKTTGEDCPAPYYRPDTVLKVMDENLLKNVGQVMVKNDMDSVLDSILVRHGVFETDTFKVYMDSSFLVAANYPLRTKEKQRGKDVPTILRVLDSLTPRTFYWRTMEANCTHRVDMCKSVLADTLYPESWSINDINLVPIHYACADSDSVYCINSKWKNDSTALGDLQERPDTIWHYSTYYVEKISDCVSFNSFYARNYVVGEMVVFVRQQMVPSEEENACGPGSKKNWMIYNLANSKMVLDDSVTVVDSILAKWKNAIVAPESLVVKELYD